ncbi:hypothetical protein Rsub_09363 [Raphidocelis subcapitata]|uniref:WW domain-containing protein n=1 Tax=Raphidocelis subcapitata TaxID=307507 RepID=A0A2V0PHC6_9CHLO|nr:hypothetical protein Rsub_09363 [Raphidocelis subcapitata]|eukprot:GBF96617.1 hypothetical protein Rsub_09363 [Raphidocelis subcapitata]
MDASPSGAAAAQPAAAAPAAPQQGAKPKAPPAALHLVFGPRGGGKTALLDYVRATAPLPGGVLGRLSGVRLGDDGGDDTRAQPDDCAPPGPAPRELLAGPNGCVCAPLAGAPPAALLASIEAANKQRGRARQVFLELPADADPAPIAFACLTDPSAARRFRLAGAVCVVGADTLLQAPPVAGPDPAAAALQRQVAFCDLLLLTAPQALPPADLARARRAARALNQSAVLIECRGGRWPQVDALLAGHAFKFNPDAPQDEAAGCSHAEPPAPASPMPRSRDAGPCAAAAAASGAAPADESAWASAATHVTPPAGAAAAAAAPRSRGRALGRVTNRVSGSTGEDSSASDSDGRSGQSQKRALDDAAPSPAAPAAAAPAAGAPTAAAAPSASPKRRCRRASRRVDAAAAAAEGAAAAAAGAAPLESVAVAVEGTLDEYRFSMFMRDLLTERAPDILRCRGVLAVHGYGPQRFVFQGVRDTITYGPGDAPWAPGEPRVSQIVFVGRGLDREELVKGFRTCVWQPLPEGWREAFDPRTGYPYYYNATTHQKTWARPQQAPQQPQPPAAGDCADAPAAAPAAAGWGAAGGAEA